MLWSIFWNAQEKRFRSFWRLLTQTALMMLVTTGVLVLQAILLPDSRVLLNSRFGPELGKLLMILPMLVPITISVLLVGKLMDRRSFADFGFHFNRRWLVDFGFGLGLGAVLMTGIFLTEWAAGWIEIQGMFMGGSANVPFAISLAASFLMFICVGFQEELLSRGYHITNVAEGLTGRLFNRKTAVCIATILSSTIFGLLHASNNEASMISTVNIMAAGVFLALGYVLTGELAIPIGLHISWNFFQGNVFGFPVSGNVLPPMIVSIKQGGSSLMTGGAFGPEAGLIGLAAIVLGSAAVVFWVRCRRNDAA